MGYEVLGEEVTEAEHKGEIVFLTSMMHNTENRNER